MSEKMPDASAPWEVDWFLSMATLAWSVGRQLRRDIALQLAPEGLTAEDFLTLRLLQKSDAGISQVELAEWLGISTAQTSGLVERLRQRGWIVAERDPQDRRRQCWIVTDQGRLEDGRLVVQLQPLALISSQGLPLEDGERLVQSLGRLQGKVTAGVQSSSPEAREVTPSASEETRRAA